MARIFSVLAVLAVLLLAANFIVGLMIGDFNAAASQKREAQKRLVELERMRTARGGSSEIDEARRAAAKADAEFQPPRARMTLHMLLGAAAALVTVLVNSITVTYFIGTSRWCKEVCDAYHLDPDLAEQSARLKRGAFPWALGGILTMIAIVGLGAASDPSGANWRSSSQFVLPHYVVAMIGVAVVVIAFCMQVNRIAENYVLIEEILAAVEKIRTARGLPIEEPSTT